MKKDYIEVTSYEGEGYQPLIHYEEWRVAILMYCEELELQNLHTMQKHNETDEVFVLLDGNCTLFVGGLGETITEIDAIKMEPFKCYNVKKGVWHTHTLDQDTRVLIVENHNTCDGNSPTVSLALEQIDELNRIYSQQVIS